MKIIFTYLRRAVVLAIALSVLLSVVGAVGAQKYDPAQGIRSSYYQIDQGMIRGIAPGTTAEKLGKVCVPAGLAPKTGVAHTGMTLSSEHSSLTVVVTADLNGDGKVSITDLLMLKSFLLGQQLPAAALAAGDVNYDTKVTITDFLRIKANLLGMEGISAGWTEGTRAQTPLMLLIPGQSVAWQTRAVSFESTNAAIAAVDAAGTVTAQTQEGTAFVYALDDRGQVLDTVLVTVLNEPLTVTVGQSSHRLISGRTLNLTAQLSHPVQTQITWTSSNTDVASVDGNGTVKAVKAGTAVITASLPNGSKAEVSLTVASPITGVNIQRTLYKIKPGASKKLALQLTPAGEEEVFTWTSSDPSVAKVSGDGTVTGVKYGTVKITASGKYSGLTASCDVKICDVKQVAMTFDDGPSNQTGKLLDFLKANNLRVTFFLVGNRMGSYRQTLQREAAEGHEIGYHSYAHQQQTGLSSAQITGDFHKSNQILKDLTGKEFTVWRTPGGGYNDRVLAAVPVPHILWSVDTLDWKSRNAASVYNSIMNHAKDGSIILLHDLYSSSVDGAIKAMTQMQAGDYEFVTVTELLSRNGTPPKASTTYYRGP